MSSGALDAPSFVISRARRTRLTSSRRFSRVNRLRSTARPYSTSQEIQASSMRVDWLHRLLAPRPRERGRGRLEHRSGGGGRRPRAKLARQPKATVVVVTGPPRHHPRPPGVRREPEPCHLRGHTVSGGQRDRTVTGLPSCNVAVSTRSACTQMHFGIWAFWRVLCVRPLCAFRQHWFLG